MTELKGARKETCRSTCGRGGKAGIVYRRTKLNVSCEYQQMFQKFQIIYNCCTHMPVLDVQVLLQTLAHVACIPPPQLDISITEIILTALT